MKHKRPIRVEPDPRTTVVVVDVNAYNVALCVPDCRIYLQLEWEVRRVARFNAVIGNINQYAGVTLMIAT